MSAFGYALAPVAVLTLLLSFACGAVIAPGDDLEGVSAPIVVASSTPVSDALAQASPTPYGVKVSELVYPVSTSTPVRTATPVLTATAIVVEFQVSLPVAVSGPVLDTSTPTMTPALLISPTATAFRKRVATPTPFWSTSTPSPTVMPTIAPTATSTPDLTAARRIGAFDWRSYEGEGYVFDRVDEGSQILLRAVDADSDVFDSVECSSDFGVSFSSIENPTFRAGGRFVWVWGVDSSGEGECWRVVADKDWLNALPAVETASADEIDALRARDMADPLIFYSELSRDRNFTMPPFGNEYPGVLIDDVWVDANGRSSVCRPDSLPYAIWDEKRGFWAMSDADMLLFDNGSDGRLTELQSDRVARIVDARERGFYLVFEPRDDDGYRWFCWGVANPDDVPVLPCYECEDSGVISE